MQSVERAVSALHVFFEEGTSLSVTELCCGGWLNQLPQDFEDFLLREMIPAAEEFSRVCGQFEPW